jgi:acyl carrier protein
MSGWAGTRSPTFPWSDGGRDLIAVQRAALARSGAGPAAFGLPRSALPARDVFRVRKLSARARRLERRKEPMVDRDQVAEQLALLIQQLTGVDAARVVLDARFVDDLDLDSVSIVEIAAAAEEKFGVKIPDSELEQFKTVADLADFIAAGAT